MLNPQRLNRAWLPVLLFLLFATVFVYVQWTGSAHNVLLEKGDFAANSLQILDAKRLRLLYGNYSRIGVHHPGPAILYVLAAGEWLFHDVLHLAPSPFSGQLLAVCFYNAAWLALIFALVRRIAGAALPALMYVLVFAGVLGVFNPTTFLGPWFPDLYILPFGAMVLAISRLAWGRTDCLRALAVASGFLVNGHVSFIPMLGVILIAMLAANRLIVGRDVELRIVSRSFLTWHRRPILVSVGILFLFFVPLLIATVTEFPGPVYDYVKFGGIDKHNGLQESLAFVASYWTPARAWIWGAVLALVLVSGIRAPAQSTLRDERALGVALVAASLALLVYAKYGVDHLEFKYIGLFYYTVPAHAAALLALYLVQAMRAEGKPVLAGLAGVAGAVGLLAAARQPLYYDYLFDAHGTPALYEQFRKIPGSGRIVIDMGRANDPWEDAWGDVVVLDLYARRHGQDLFCIGRGWHILFTRAAQCRPDELQTTRHFFVRPAQYGGKVAEVADLEGQGLVFYRDGRQLTPIEYTTVADHKDYFGTILGSGWSKIETDFVWSLGTVATLNLPADPKRTGPLHLDLGGFFPHTYSHQAFSAVVNGKLVGHWDFDASEPRRQFSIDLGPDPGAAQHIELRLENAISPLEAGWGPDGRVLGLSLYGMR
jgi:hypothetical protein